MPEDAFVLERIRVIAMLASLTACGARPPAPATPPVAADELAGAAADDDDDHEPADADLPTYIRDQYDKREVEIPMRDGTVLFTSIYAPKDRTDPKPIMLLRTPYSVAPYGDEYRTSLGPSEVLARKDWFFVYQDVRGRFMSDGTFVNMTPHKPKRPGSRVIDESTDTYDTIEWLLENVEGHNGKVGQWGISYPGFYAAAGMVDAHPALRAVSPQAPIADWYFDDFHHHGAFFLPHAFNFFAFFGQPRRGRTKDWPARFNHGTKDGYAFFLKLGSLANANRRHFEGDIGFWNDLAAHPDYDGFWKARNILPHLSNVAPAVMTVGGLFDAEDLYGPLAVYRTVEAKNPNSANTLVMGPWRHGGWARTTGQRLGRVDFGAETSSYYQAEVEAPFFQHYLAGGPSPELPEALIFETGRNRWRSFDAWPPPTTPGVMFVGNDGRLTSTAPTDVEAFEAWVSDPQHPVPSTEKTMIGMDAQYMVDDQRFASRRPDVITLSTEPLGEALTIAGAVEARIFVSTDRDDADFVVKLIDVFPDDATMPDEDGKPTDFGGYQMMVRSEVFRARYRNGYDAPTRMKRRVPTEITIPLQAVLHSFEPGHRVMIQIQSSWFPMVDRNPQRWVDNIFEAKDGDFVPANHRLYHDSAHRSRIEFGTLDATP